MTNEEYYLISWDDIPGRDSKQLIGHLEKCLKANWVKGAEIEKSDDNKTITVTDGKNSLTLRLAKERHAVVLKLGEEETYEYILRKENGKLNIYNKEIVLILRELDSEDDEELEKLAKTITKRSWKDPRVVVNIWHSDDEDDSSKAAAVLLSMEDIALTPLLDALSPDIPEDYVWDMETIVEIQMENRIKIAKALEDMLQDKRFIKLPELPPSTEESHAPRRVCDEAYLIMRRLLSFEEDEEEQFFNSNEFLNMTDEEKDAEISRAKASKRWIPPPEQFFEGEE